MRVPPRQTPEPGEWQREPGPYGRLFRRVGNSIEYEPIIGDLPAHVFYDSQEALRKQREEDMERERREAVERAANRRNCPFVDSNGSNTDCKREACALFIGESCTLAGDKAPADTAGRICPFDRYGKPCRTDCALYRNGCTLTTIFTK